MTHHNTLRWLRIRMVVLVSVALVLFVGLGVAAWSMSGEDATQDGLRDTNQGFSTSASLESGSVVRVVDGDTIVVRFEDGSKEKVRLVGINAPESVAADTSRNTEEGHVSSEYLKQYLDEGTSVWLQTDISDRDQYDRLLRYVWLAPPSANPDEREVAENMLNGLLVDQGYARAKRYKPDTAYEEIFESLALNAVREGRGVSYLWA